MTKRINRLTTLYHDLSIRHKDLQFEIRLLRTRAEPFSTEKEAKAAQDKLIDMVKRIGTETEKEWPRMKQELIAMGHAAVPFLLEVYRGAGATAMRRAGEVLLAIRDPRAAPPLLVGLGHPKTRMISAEALGELGVKKVARDLALHLKDEKADIRRIVADSLGKLGDLSGVPILIARLDHPDDSSRILAMTTLRRITGQNFEFDPYGAEEDQKNGIKMWNRWWNTNKSRFDLALDLEKEGERGMVPGEGELPGGEEKEGGEGK
ncbi:MAG: HEAT repeat domain-containing protein [Planctomycetota bacterium]